MPDHIVYSEPSGGRNWLDLTRGTDCTEAFETFHVFGVSEGLLKRFWVKKANTPRRYRSVVREGGNICEFKFKKNISDCYNFRFTFHPNGFFKTLQRKGATILKKTGTGPDWSSSLIQDFLTLSFLICFILLCYYPSFINAFVAGELWLYCWSKC